MTKIWTYLISYGLCPPLEYCATSWLVLHVYSFRSALLIVGVLRHFVAFRSDPTHPAVGVISLPEGEGATHPVVGLVTNNKLQKRA